MVLRINTILLNSSITQGCSRDENLLSRRHQVFIPTFLSCELKKKNNRVAGIDVKKNRFANNLNTKSPTLSFKSNVTDTHTRTSCHFYIQL